MDVGTRLTSRLYRSIVSPMDSLGTQRLRVLDLYRRSVERGDGPILGFFEAHRFLSNFHLWPITFESALYPSTEHAYQAAKTLDPEARLVFQSGQHELSCTQAKHLGRDLRLRKDWERAKLGVMTTVLREKFKDPVLRAALLETGDRELVELNWWGDLTWGRVLRDERCVGENFLGRILMKIRAEVSAH